jgi:DNA-directed RNA polymerase specialized sigma24 family protein
MAGPDTVGPDMAGRDVSTEEQRELERSRRAPRGLSRRELELVGRAKEGDGEALRELLVRRYRFLLDEFQQLLPPSQRDALLGYDWLSAMHAVAAESIRDAEPSSEARLQAWLSDLAERTLRQHYSEAIEPKLPAEPWTWSSEETPDSVLSELDRHESLRGDIRQCLDELPEDERVLVHVRDYVGASWETIASTLGYRSPQHARACHLQALRKLADLMERRRVG